MSLVILSTQPIPCLRVTDAVSIYVFFSSLNLILPPLDCEFSQLNLQCDHRIKCQDLHFTKTICFMGSRLKGRGLELGATMEEVGQDSRLGQRPWVRSEDMGKWTQVGYIWDLQGFLGL
jgi:hypothetical protein